MWLQGRLGFIVTGGGIACETHPQSACSLVTFDCCRITPAAHDLFPQEGFPVFVLVRPPSWNQGGNNDRDLGMVQGERGSCLYSLMCKGSAIHELVRGSGAWISAAWPERPASLCELWCLPSRVLVGHFAL